MTFNEKHFEKLLSIKKSLDTVEEEFGTRTGYDWVKGLKVPLNIEFPGIESLKTPLNRQKLFELASDKNMKTITLCAAIFAWGGMHIDHGKRIFSDKDAEWIGVAEEIRGEEMTRKEAYDKFLTLRKNNKIKGMGPAFFTKLIFFYGRKKSKRSVTLWISGWAAQ
ncbi:MAG: hypothetical protein ACK5V0_09255 [Alphaproteobacteria bacterium]